MEAARARRILCCNLPSYKQRGIGQAQARVKGERERSHQQYSRWLHYSCSTDQEWECWQQCIYVTIVHGRQLQQLAVQQQPCLVLQSDLYLVPLYDQIQFMHSNLMALNWKYIHVAAFFSIIAHRLSMVKNCFCFCLKMTLSHNSNHYKEF